MIVAPGGGSPVSRLQLSQPMGSAKGESIETRVGEHSRVAEISSSVVAILRVSTFPCLSTHHPVGRFSEPVRSIPTTQRFANDCSERRDPAVVIFGIVAVRAISDAIILI